VVEDDQEERQDDDGDRRREREAAAVGRLPRLHARLGPVGIRRQPQSVRDEELACPMLSVAGEGGREDSVHAETPRRRTSTSRLTGAFAVICTAELAIIAAAAPGSPRRGMRTRPSPRVSVMEPSMMRGWIRRRRLAIIA